MKISVGLCTYNGEKYIGEQLNSIINQTVKPDEIIVADDNSTDNTVSIVNDLLSSSGIDYQLKEYKTHQGIRCNFENVFNACSGDVIFSCDQDDIWKPNKIECFLQYFYEGYDFVYSNSIVVDSKRNVINPDYWSCYGLDFTKLSIEQFRFVTLTNRAISGYNMAFTRDFLLKVLPFPEHFIHDDWMAICSTWFGNVAFIDRPLTEYRIHEKNTSGFGGNRQTSLKPETHSANKKKLFPEIYYTSKPSEWFGDAHMYLASVVFYERMKDVISKDFKTITEQYIKHKKNMLDCIPKNRLRAVFILLKEFFTGRYYKFRGGVNRWVRDILYICVNKNCDYIYDLNIKY